jgi:hypothetical protein
MIEAGSVAVVVNKASYYNRVVVTVYHVVEDGNGVLWALTDADTTSKQNSVWFKTTELEVM